MAQYGVAARRRAREEPTPVIVIRRRLRDGGEVEAIMASHDAYLTRRGERHYDARLTTQLVEAARVLHEDHGFNGVQVQAWLAEWHGISISAWAVRKALTYRSW